MVSYATRDWWTVSVVEKMRNDYSDAIARVESRLVSAYANLDAAQSSLCGGAGKFTALIAQDWSSEGQFETDLEAAVERWKANGLALISRLRSTTTLLDLKLATMRARLRVLDQLWLDEDAQEQELTEEDIPF